MLVSVDLSMYGNVLSIVIAIAGHRFEAIDQCSGNFFAKECVSILPVNGVIVQISSRKIR